MAPKNLQSEGVLAKNIRTMNTEDPVAAPPTPPPPPTPLSSAPAESAPASPALDASVAALRAAIFARSPLRRKQAALLNASAQLPKDATILLILPDEAVAEALRRQVAEVDPPSAATRKWTCAAFSDAHLALLRAANVPGSADAPVLALPSLPLATGTLDSVVASDCLEYVPDPALFMKELHRVLKPKTKLVLHIRRRRRSLVDALRRVAGLVDASRPALYPGFTPTELFDALKDGFDIEERLAYGRFFTELTTVLAELFAGFVPQSAEPLATQASSLSRAKLVFGLFTPLFWLSRALDTLCFFLPAHHLVIRAKRRMLWAPRIAPRMRDGRTIAEVVLGGKIGTAVGK